MRATLSAAMSVLGQVGWIIGGLWYAWLQATLGFEAGYRSASLRSSPMDDCTVRYRVWLREVDRRMLGSRVAA